MKKTLLAAALVAGFAGVAHAESSVTLYGLADVGYGFKTQTIKANGESKVKHRYVGAYNGVKNGSRWGLKGSEDLGNGTSAIFQVESGFKIGNGTSAQEGQLFGRQAYVGLTGESWGTFTIGRQYNAADAFVGGIDPFQTGWEQAGSFSTFGESLSARYDNAIKYVSPNFEGFQFGVGVFHQDDKYEKDGKYQAGADGKKTEKSTGVTVGLGYNNAGLEVGASFDYARTKPYDYVDAAKTVAKETTSKKAWNLGVAYDFDVVKLHAIYGQQRDGSWGSELNRELVGARYGVDGDGKLVGNGKAFYADGYKSQAWLVGLTAPVGEAGKVLFSYQGSKAKNDEVVDGLRYNTHVFSLGYAHNLSKRTALYALASYGKVKAKFENGNRDKLKSTQVVAGLQHRF